MLELIALGLAGLSVLIALPRPVKPRRSPFGLVVQYRGTRLIMASR